MSEFATWAASGGSGERVALARRNLGLTQRQLAARLGVSLWHVDQIEAGVVDPSAHVPAIASLTGRAVEWFSPNTRTEARGPTPLTMPAALSASEGSGRLLVLGSIVVLVTVRFFTETVPIVPRAANFVDIPILAALAGAALTQRREHIRYRAAYMSFAVPAFAFLALCALSTLANPSRVAPAPVFVFLYGFMAPLVIYSATRALWTPGNARVVLTVLVWLGVINLTVVALIDVPRFLATQNPDYISGTFGTNQYQFVYFMLLVAAAVMVRTTFSRGVLGTWIAPAILSTIGVSILLAQYRALLPTTVLTLIMLALLLGNRVRGVGVGLLMLFSFFIALSYVAVRLPVLKFGQTVQTIQESPTLYIKERLKVAAVIPRLYSDHPTAFVYGTGPGTFSSRAWQTFANARSTSRSNVQGRYALAFTGGETYSTDVSQMYVTPLLEQNTLIGGSRAVASPYSSYLALLAEVGIVGFLLMVGIYVRAFANVCVLTARQLRDPNRSDVVGILVVATTAFFILLQMGFLENWLEVSRLTFVAWALFAIGVKESQAALDQR
jgi:hypothetical protein